ncbi:hypothetical protein EC991_011340 [Linnemannia zychae]|nr:hypothetical protein EC991_011340 [Linnemannia zychae]
MGYTPLHCVATNKETGISYAVSMGYPTNIVSSRVSMGEATILVSESNPSQMGVFNWRKQSQMVASIIPYESANLACAVSSAGEFLVIGSNLTESATGTPFGFVVYNSDSGGPLGTWTSLLLESNYLNQTFTSTTQHKVFYQQEEGKEVLTHVAVVGDDIVIGREAPHTSDLTYNLKYHSTYKGNHGGLKLSTIWNPLTDSLLTESSTLRGREIPDTMQKSEVFEPIRCQQPDQTPFAFINWNLKQSNFDLTGSDAGVVRDGGAIWTDGVYGIGGGYFKTNNSDDEDPNKGLAVKVGFGIVGSLALVVVVYILLRRRSRRRQVGTKSLGKVDEDHSSVELGIASGNTTRNPNCYQDGNVSSPPPHYDDAWTGQPTGLSSHPRPAVATTVGGST